MLEYAALVASPRALPDGLILVFQYPVRFSCIAGVPEPMRLFMAHGLPFFPIHYAEERLTKMK